MLLLLLSAAAASCNKASLRLLLLEKRLLVACMKAQMSSIFDPLVDRNCERQKYLYFSVLDRR